MIAYTVPEESTENDTMEGHQGSADTTGFEQS
jgi:hypothetical protein